MGLDYDTSIVEDAVEAAMLIGLDELDNATVEGGLSVEDRLLTAHRWVYDRLRSRHGTDALAVLSNPEVLKPAVAFRFAEQLAANGLIGGESAAGEGVRDYYGGQAIAIVDGFRPEYSDARDGQRTSSEPRPRLANLTRRPLFGGGQNDIFTGRPRRRS